MLNQQESTKIPKYPLRLKIDSLLVFLSFHLLFWVLYFFCRIYKTEETLKLLFSVPYFIYFAASALVCIVLNEAFIPLFSQYDGTEQSVKKVNKTVSAFILLQMMFAIICCLFFPTSIKLACKQNDFYYIPHDPIFCAAGSFCLSATLCFIFWLEHFEAWLKWLPFKKENILFSTIVRRLLVVLFAVVGIVMGQIVTFKNSKLFCCDICSFNPLHSFHRTSFSCLLWTSTTLLQNHFNPNRLQWKNFLRYHYSFSNIRRINVRTISFCILCR